MVRFLSRLVPALGTAVILSAGAAQAQVCPVNGPAEQHLSARAAAQANGWSQSSLVWLVRVAEVSSPRALSQESPPPVGRRVVLESLLALKGPAAQVPRYLELVHLGADTCDGVGLDAAERGQVGAVYVVYAGAAPPTAASVSATVPAGDLRDAATLQAWAANMPAPASAAP